MKEAIDPQNITKAMKLGEKLSESASSSEPSLAQEWAENSSIVVLDIS